jgi:hypothetical protein
LANKLYADVLRYLDEITSKYIQSIMRCSPISTGSAAPRMTPESGDKDVSELNRQIPKNLSSNPRKETKIDKVNGLTRRQKLNGVSFFHFFSFTCIDPSSKKMTFDGINISELEHF